MGNDTYLSNSDVINKLDDLSAAVGGTTVPTTTTKTNTDFVIGINKSIDAASGRTGVEYPPYSHNTLVTDKLDELAEAIAEGGGGEPGPTPVMGALSVTENGEYLPSSYNYDGFSSVSVDVPAPTPSLLPVKVLDNGQVSTTSSYSTANFTESIADYEYVVVIFSRTNPNTQTTDESHVNRGVVFKVSDIVDANDSLNFTWGYYGGMNGFEKTMYCTITLTSISTYDYSGSWNDLYCDVYAYPTGLLRYPD